ncbi:MAG: DUF1015 family protein [Bradymonadales bacterium]|nr:DUF1015 family protein [Bradymonadales bacterium]
MATISPFRAVRYELTRAGNPRDLVSYPQHLLDTDTRQRLCARNRHNVCHLTADLFDGQSEPLDLAGVKLPFFRRWLKEGVLRQDRDHGLYLYEQSCPVSRGRQIRQGFFGLVLLDPPQSQSILPHAHGRPDQLDTCLQRIRTTQAILEPVSLLFEDPDGAIAGALIEARSAFPDLALTTDDQIEHRLFYLTDPVQIQKIVEPLQDASLLIADNHSGYEAAQAYQAHCQVGQTAPGHGSPRHASSHMLAFLTGYPSEATSIAMNHLVIRDLPDFSFPAFLRRMAERFQLTQLPSLRNMEQIEALLQEAGRNAPAFAVLAGGAGGRRVGYLAVLDLERAAPRLAGIPGPPELARSEPMVLDELILRDLLGIAVEAGQRSPHLSEVAQVNPLLQIGRSSQTQLVIMTNEIAIPALERLSRSGGRLPSEPTHIVPAPLSGLVFFDLTAHP